MSVLLLLPIFVELLVAPARWYSGWSQRKGRTDSEAPKEAQAEAQAEGDPVELVELNVAQDNIV